MELQLNTAGFDKYRLAWTDHKISGNELFIPGVPLSEVQLQSNKDRLPRAMSVYQVPEDKRPRLEDWVYIQGGMPEIVPTDRDFDFFKIIHRYENTRDASGTGAVVPTPISIAESWSNNPTVSKKCKDGVYRDFPGALLWEKHGKPCEQRSGGRGAYERIKVTSQKK